MDTVYPQPIRLKLGVAERRKRGSQNRYRTQPVTFSEIKEMDEEIENTDEESADLNRRLSTESNPVMSSKSSSSVNAHFEELFARKRERKLNRKLLNKMEFPKQQIFTTIPGSPEGTDCTETTTSQNGIASKK